MAQNLLGYVWSS